MKLADVTEMECVINFCCQSTTPWKTVHQTGQDTSVTNDHQAVGNSQSDGLVSISVSAHNCRIVLNTDVVIQ